MALKRRDEERLLEQLVQLAPRCGWALMHVSDSRKEVRWREGAEVRSALVGDVLARGFPDLVLARETIIYRELKSDIGTLDAHQKWWMKRLELAGQDVDVWRPRDLYSVILPRLEKDAWKYAELPLPPVSPPKSRLAGASSADFNVSTSPSRSRGSSLSPLSDAEARRMISEHPELVQPSPSPRRPPPRPPQQPPRQPPPPRRRP